MDGQRFDDQTKALTSGEPRRKLLLAPPGEAVVLKEGAMHRFVLVLAFVLSLVAAPALPAAAAEGPPAGQPGPLNFCIGVVRSELSSDSQQQAFDQILVGLCLVELIA